ncbi:MAG: type II toxin-antitoxin system VapC family toxin [Acidobacteriota bacterium]
MPAYFLDSSALVKRYVNEVGTVWIQALTRTTTGHLIWISRITTIEVVAALARRVRTGSLTPHDAAIAIAQFKAEIATDFRIMELTQALANRAIQVAETHQLRGYDALQLAAALQTQDKLLARGVITSSFPYTLISADAELNAAAALEGVAVDDPNNHP